MTPREALELMLIIANRAPISRLEQAGLKVALDVLIQATQPPEAETPTETKP